MIQTQSSTDRESSINVFVGRLFQAHSRTIKDIIMREKGRFVIKRWNVRLKKCGAGTVEEARSERDHEEYGGETTEEDDSPQHGYWGFIGEV